MEKINDAEMDDELRPEYDRSSLTGGTRGKYAARYQEGTNIVVLDDAPQPQSPAASRDTEPNITTYL
jgi:hypothetical protein